MIYLSWGLPEEVASLSLVSEQWWGLAYFECVETLRTGVIRAMLPPETCRRILPGFLPSGGFLAIFAIPWLVDISLWPSVFTRHSPCVSSHCLPSMHIYLCVQSSPFYKDQWYWSRSTLWWPHFNLITSGKALSPKRWHSVCSGIRTLTYLLMGDKIQPRIITMKINYAKYL